MNNDSEQRIVHVADAFGIRSMIEGGVQLVRVYFEPMIKAHGENRAALIRQKGLVELEKQKHQLEIIERAEQKLCERNLPAEPVSPNTLFRLLDLGSHVSEPDLQNLWAELLAASAIRAEEDTRISLYAQLLTQLTIDDAQVLTALMQTLPETEAEVTLSFIATHMENDDEIRVTCYCRIQDESESSQFEETLRLDHARFLFVLANLRRLGLIYVSSDQPYVLAANGHHSFNLTRIGLSFVACLGLIRSSVLALTDYEQLDRQLNNPRRQKW